MQPGVNRATLEDLIANDVHLKIAACIEDALSLRAFCTCGSRKLLALWNEIAQASCSVQASSGFTAGLLQRYRQFRFKLFGKLVKRVIASVRVRTRMALLLWRTASSLALHV